MEEEKAVKILTKRLAENSGGTLVFNKVHQKEIIKNTDLVYIVGDPKIIECSKDYQKYFFRETKSEVESDEGGQDGGKLIREVLQGKIPEEANYLFDSTETTLCKGNPRIKLVPYAIIGDKERRAIKKRFYKSDDLEVREAIKSLEIENFFGLYNLYANREFFAFYNLLDEFLQNQQITESLAQNPINHQHFKIKDVTKKDHDLDRINSLIKRMGVKCGVFKEEYEVCTEYLNILIGHLNSYSDFFRFVFDLPLDEQDIATNKLLLKHPTSSLNIEDIIIKEYSQGAFFKEYFGMLDKYQKENSILLLKNCMPHDSGYNSFLFGLGFKDVLDLTDFRSLYEHEPKKFIEAFPEECEEKKIAILKNLLESDVLNDEVNKWLNENELEAIREAGMF